MKYANARGRIQDGDIVFFNQPTAKSWFIRAVTFARWSHVGIAVVEDMLDEPRVFMLEQVLSGRQLSNMSIRAGDVAVLRPRSEGVSRSDLEVLSDFADNTGEKYSMWNAVVAGLNLPRFLKSSDTHICSEMVADYLFDIGLWRSDETLLHPQKLYKILRKNFMEVA